MRTAWTVVGGVNGGAVRCGVNWMAAEVPAGCWVNEWLCGGGTELLGGLGVDAYSSGWESR